MQSFIGIKPNFDNLKELKQSGYFHFSPQKNSSNKKITRGLKGSYCHYHVCAPLIKVWKPQFLGQNSTKIWKILEI